MSTLAVDLPRNLYRRGAILILAAGMLWSTTGALMRFAPDLDAWQFLLFRCIGMAFAIGLLGLWQGQGSMLSRYRRLGRDGVIVTVAFSLATISFIFAIKITSVANALFLNSFSPIISAVLGAAILKEKITRGIVGAIALGLFGFAVIVIGEVHAGNLFGNIAALLSALGFAVCAVCIRRAKGKDFAAAILIYAVACALIAGTATFLAGNALAPPAVETLTAFASGFVFMGLGFTLFVRGAPYIPAAGQTVLAQTETVFGPLWVWLLFAEAPLPTTLAGGVIILIAVIAMALVGARDTLQRVAS